MVECRLHQEKKERSYQWSLCVLAYHRSALKRPQDLPLPTKEIWKSTANSDSPTPTKWTAECPAALRSSLTFDFYDPYEHRRAESIKEGSPFEHSAVRTIKNT